MRITAHGQVWKVIEIDYAEEIRDYALLVVGEDDGNRGEIRAMSVGIASPRMVPEEEPADVLVATQPANVAKVGASANPGAFPVADPMTSEIERQIREKSDLQRRCEILEIALTEALLEWKAFALRLNEGEKGEHALKRIADLRRLIGR